MKQRDEALLISILEQALEAKVGIEVQFLDAAAARLFRTFLYKVRNGHPEYKALSFLQSGTNLWVLHREVKYDDPID